MTWVWKGWAGLRVESGGYGGSPGERVAPGQGKWLLGGSNLG